jgi:hypothetical protein
MGMISSTNSSKLKIKRPDFESKHKPNEFIEKYFDENESDEAKSFVYYLFRFGFEEDEIYNLIKDVRFSRSRHILTKYIFHVSSFTDEINFINTNDDFARMNMYEDYTVKINLNDFYLKSVYVYLSDKFCEDTENYTRFYIPREKFIGLINKLNELSEKRFEKENVFPNYEQLEKMFKI